MPQSQSYHDVGRGHGPPHPQQYPDPAALRSKSTSHLDSHDLPYHGQDNRQVMSTSTLPGPGGRPQRDVSLQIFVTPLGFPALA